MEASASAITRVQLGGGHVVLARVAGVETPAVTEGALQPPSLPAAATVIDTIRAVGEAVQEAIETVRPDKASVEFGIELEGSGGIPIVAQGKATAHLTVALEWEFAEASQNS
jgi:hypothetical protein